MMNRKELELYIHIPFCVKKCAYCDFLSCVTDEDTKEKYVRYLIKEIDMVSRDISDKYEVVSVFIGGGTPSILKGEQIKEIIRKLQKVFLFSYNAEISIECNPGTLDYEKLLIYKKSGINRLSFGLQSTNNEELKHLGRIHSYEEFLESYKLARKLGFDNINIDLMSALPYQTVESFKRTLETVIQLEPEHISAYSLIIEEDTPFYEMYKDGKNLPSESEDRQIYHATKAIMAKNGYNRYEISNYAKQGFECKHNVGYWTGVYYRGFGLGASSYMEGIRFSNPDIVEKYVKYINSSNMIEPNRTENCLNCSRKYVKHDSSSNEEEIKCNESKATAVVAPAYQLQEKNQEEYLIKNIYGLELEILSKQAMYEEFMFLGLRLTKGVSEKEFNNRFKIQIDEVYGQVLSENIKKGLIIKKNGYICLSDKGIDLSNSVMAEFLF